MPTRVKPKPEPIEDFKARVHMMKAKKTLTIKDFPVTPHINDKDFKNVVGGFAYRRFLDFLVGRKNMSIGVTTKDVQDFLKKYPELKKL